MSELSNQSRQVRTLLLGDRIDTAGLERNDVLSTTPLAFRVGGGGFAVLFWYGVAVLIGMSPLEEDEIVRGLAGRIIGPLARREEESAQIEITLARELALWAFALADIINTERSLRLERIIIALILLETIFAGYQMFFR